MYVTIPSEFPAKPNIAALASSTHRSNASHFKAGTYLYFEQDDVEWLYQVTSGVLRLTRLLEDGRRQVIAFGYPGDIVGFPSDGVHHTDCDILVDATLQPYSKSVLDCGDGDPQLHQALLHAALREISAMQDHFMMLGRKSALEKVSSFLCVLAERVGQDCGEYKQLNLPMNRADIADFLGLTTETVSRTLTQLRKSDVIAIENVHTIIVLHPAQLFKLSQGDHTSD